MAIGVMTRIEDLNTVSNTARTFMHVIGYPELTKDLVPKYQLLFSELTVKLFSALWRIFSNREWARCLGVLHWLNLRCDSQ